MQSDLKEADFIFAKLVDSNCMKPDLKEVVVDIFMGKVGIIYQDPPKNTRKLKFQKACHHLQDTGVESIDMGDYGMVKITARDLASLEKSKAIMSNLTMVPSVGDIDRNCEIKSIAPCGVFVEIALGRKAQKEDLRVDLDRAKKGSPALR